MSLEPHVALARALLAQALHDATVHRVGIGMSTREAGQAFLGERDPNGDLAFWCAVAQLRFDAMRSLIDRIERAGWTPRATSRLIHGLEPHGEQVREV